MKPALAVLALIAVIVAAILGGYAIKYYTADTRGKIAANEAIHANAQFRIEAYDRFFNQCAAVQTIEATLAATRAELSSHPTERREEQLHTNLTALVGARAEAVNQYNADAHKGYTAGQFRSNDLPPQLPVEIPEGGTQCVA